MIGCTVRNNHRSQEHPSPNPTTECVHRKYPTRHLQESMTRTHLPVVTMCPKAAATRNVVQDLPSVLIANVLQYAHADSYRLHIYTERYRSAVGDIDSSTLHQLYRSFLQNPAYVPPGFERGLALSGFDTDLEWSCSGYVKSGFLYTSARWPVGYNCNSGIVAPAIQCDWTPERAEYTTDDEYTNMLTKNRIQPNTSGLQWPHRLSICGELKAGVLNEVPTPPPSAYSMCSSSLLQQHHTGMHMHTRVKYHTRVPLIQCRTIAPHADCTDVCYRLLFVFLPESRLL
jgi:hypothetical protein